MHRSPYHPHKAHANVWNLISVSEENLESGQLTALWTSWAHSSVDRSFELCGRNAPV